MRKYINSSPTGGELWVVNRVLWVVGCGLWAVGCGSWIVGGHGGNTTIPLMYQKKLPPVPKWKQQIMCPTKFLGTRLLIQFPCPYTIHPPPKPKGAGKRTLTCHRLLMCDEVYKGKK